MDTTTEGIGEETVTTDAEAPPQPGAPVTTARVLEDLGLHGLKVYPWGNTAAFSGRPIGEIQWGPTAYEVYCATPVQYEECRSLCDGAPIRRGWNVTQDGTSAQKAQVAFRALGGEGRSPLTVEQLESAPHAFSAVITVAIVAFLWGGAVSSAGDPLPQPKPV